MSAILRFTWTDAQGVSQSAEIPKEAVLHAGVGGVAAVVLVFGDADQNGQVDITGQAVGDLPQPWSHFVPEGHLPLKGGFLTKNVPIKEILEKVAPAAVEAIAIPLSAVPAFGPAAAQSLRAGLTLAEKILL